MYTRLYLKWITSKDLLHSTGNSAQCYMTGWMGGEFRGEWICVYICMSESLCYASKTITTLLIGYLLILNKKLFLKKKYKHFLWKRSVIDHFQIHKYALCRGKKFFKVLFEEL